MLDAKMNTNITVAEIIDGEAHEPVTFRKGMKVKVLHEYVDDEGKNMCVIFNEKLGESTTCFDGFLDFPF
jgi:hypothetical protein